MYLLNIALIISVLGKLLLHLYLDSKKKKSLQLEPDFVSLEYFFFYLEDVDKKYRTKKLVCNALYLISIILLIFILIFDDSPTTREILLKP